MNSPASYGSSTFCCVSSRSSHVSSRFLRNTQHVLLRKVTVCYGLGVHPVLLRMSRSVTVITVREVYRYKMAYRGDKFLHIGAVTKVNKTDHTLHYAIEDELQSRTFLISSAVCC